MANLITVVRAFLLPISIFLHFRGSHRAAFAVMIAIIISDWLDGRAARALNQAGRIGMRLDAWADFAVCAVRFAVLAVIPLAAGIGSFFIKRGKARSMAGLAWFALGALAWNAYSYWRGSPAVAAVFIALAGGAALRLAFAGRAIFRKGIAVAVCGSSPQLPRQGPTYPAAACSSWPPRSMIGVQPGASANA